MKVLVPSRLKEGDKILVVSPATSLALISANVRDTALANFASLGLTVEFAPHAKELTDHINQSSTVSSRVRDLHDAFQDQRYKAIFTTLGGFNCNQLLTELNFELIGSNPKIFCGYSDVTALLNAIFAKTGLITYYGPHFSTLGMKYGLEYTLTHLQLVLFHGQSVEVHPSQAYRDEAWFLDQESFNAIPNDGLSIIKKGQASGIILGGNLSTFVLLLGTPWMPCPSGDVILFLEEDGATGELSASYFQRRLQAVLHQQSRLRIRGIVLGRFQRISQVDEHKIRQIIDGLVGLASDIPIVSNVDFGHTSPMLTIPIGGQCLLDTMQEKAKILISDK